MLVVIIPELQSSSNGAEKSGKLALVSLLLACKVTDRCNIS